MDPDGSWILMDHEIMMMMMMCISPFDPVGCGRPLRGGEGRDIEI
jgi:hypothetical protein